LSNPLIRLETQELIPPPWNYQIYVTFGATASSKDIVFLCDKLYNYVLESATDYLFAGLRLDFIFFPNASPSACVQHYRAEKRARVATDLALVPTYETEGMGALDYKAHNVLLMLTNEDISGHGIQFLKFDTGSAGGQETESDIPPRIHDMSKTYRFYEQPKLPETGWIMEPLEELYRFSKVRSQFEQEYRVAKKGVRSLGRIDTGLEMTTNTKSVSAEVDFI
jgi:hypothetical protein